MLKIINIYCFLVVLITLSVTNANAIPNDTQSWNLLTALMNLDNAKNYAVYLEAQPRIGDNVTKTERLLLRSALVYNYDKQLSFYGGYGWTPTFTNANYDHDLNDESRTWQQVVFKQDILGLSWQHRFRQEQRFVQGADSVSHRSRYLLRGSHTLDNEGMYGLTGYNEIFINLNDTGKARAQGYDRNRFFFGPYLNSGIVRYEAGYLVEHGRRFGPEQRLINAFLISANITY